MPLAVTFGQSLILLGVTAVLAPIIVGITNSSRLNEQKHYEEGLKRETAFFESQAQFLKDFSDAVWHYFEKALAVSYAGMFASEQFKDLWDEYEKASFDLLGRIGSQVTMARTLFSSETADQFSVFYHRWVEDVFDLGLSARARDPKTTQDEWRRWHVPMHQEAQTRAEALIEAVAEEAGLTYEQQLRRLQPRPGYLRRLLRRSQ